MAYLSPDNPLAKLIVLLLWFLFLAWLFLLLWSVYSYRRDIAIVATLNRIVPQLANLLRIRRASDASGVEAQASVVDEHIAAAGVDVHSPLAEVLRLVYQSVTSGVEVNLPEAVRSAERRILRGDTLIKNFVNIFVIIGLLGTLVGLSDSVMALIAIKGAEGDVLDRLFSLLRSLKGAFAPSISGVLASIIGIILYSLAQRFGISPLLEEFRAAVLTRWYPHLKNAATPPVDNRGAIRELRVASDAWSGQVNKLTAAMHAGADNSSLLLGKIGELGSNIGQWARKLEQISAQAQSAAKSASDVVVLLSKRDEYIKLHESDLKEQRDDISRTIVEVRRLMSETSEHLSITAESIAGSAEVFRQTVSATLLEAGESLRGEVRNVQEVLQSQLEGMKRDAMAVINERGRTQGIEGPDKNYERLTAELASIRTVAEGIRSSIDGQSRIMQRFAQQVDGWQVNLVRRDAEGVSLWRRLFRGR
jgi:biopolymer transport protein ExbB/TolQ